MNIGNWIFIVGIINSGFWAVCFWRKEGNNWCSTIHIFLISIIIVMMIMLN